MAQFITLEEAADRLGIPADDFKRRLKTEWVQLVPMRDGPTLRFRVTQIDELARQLGGASDPALPLAPDRADPRSDDFRVPGGRTPDEPLVFDGGGSDDDIFSLTADEPGAKKPRPGDSDVRLEGAGPRKGLPPVPTEEIALDLAGPGSAVIKGGGSSAKLSAPKSGAKLSAQDGGKKGGGNLSAPVGGGGGANTGDSSEFELSLDADSDDFELQLNADSSDEVDLGSSPVETGGGGAKSGINLRDPKDSGIPLGGGKPAASPNDSDSDLDFELSLDPSPVETSRPAAGPRPAAKPPVTSDSDSEFELTLDDSRSGSSLENAALSSAERNKGDIFETDFEIPPMADESGSEAVAVDSDTDLEDPSGVEVADDEATGSQVVPLEDDELADESPSSEIDVVDEEESVATALRRRAADDDDEPITVPSSAASAAPAPWGPWPAVILAPALLLVTIGTLTGFEMIKSMNGYQQPRKPAAPLIRGIASNLDMPLNDQ